MKTRPRAVATPKIELIDDGLCYVDAATQQRTTIPWAQIERPLVVRTYLARSCLLNLALLVCGVLAMWLLPWLVLKIAAAAGISLALLIRWRGQARENLEFSQGRVRLRLYEDHADRDDLDDPFYYEGIVTDILSHQGRLPSFEQKPLQRHPLGDYRCLGCGGGAFEGLSNGVYRCSQCHGVLELFKETWFCPDSEVMLRANQTPCRWAEDQSAAPVCAACAVTTKICLEVDGNYYRCPSCDAAWYPLAMAKRIFVRLAHPTDKSSGPVDPSARQR